jgi:hypothetical protein
VFVAAWLAAVSGARAFSDSAVFARPAFEGGGGGRYFTGSPRDGLSCGVCHSGGELPDVEIIGLPRVLVAGQARDVLIRWSAPAQALAGSHALQLELMSRDGAHAGLELPERALLPAESRCEQRADGESAAFATDVGERRIVGVSDCGASELRFRFTTPDVQELFFSIGVVRSDGSGTPDGDGVFEWRRRIGTLPVETELTAGCSVFTPLRGEPPTAAWLVLCLVLWRLGRLGSPWRRRRRRLALCMLPCLLLGCVTGHDEPNRRERPDAAPPYVEEFAALLDAAVASGGPDVRAECGRDPSSLSQLHFSVRTVSGEGRYRPRNVGAIWIEDAEQHWLRTLARWGKQRAKWLTEFNAASGGDVTDAITTATLPRHEVHELDWDLRDAAGCQIPNGEYALRIELTDWSGTGENTRIDFDKTEEPITLEPADVATFRDLRLSLE